MAGIRGMRLLAWMLVLIPFSIYSAQLTKINILKQTKPLSLGLTLTDQVKPYIFVLHQPERVVVDLPNTHLQMNPAFLARSTAIIKNVRVGYPKPKVLRLVFDMRQSTQARKVPWSKGVGIEFIVATNTAASKKAHSPAAKVTYPPRTFNRDVIVVLDPGHGGKDPGAVGKKRTQEKMVVLQIAKKTEKFD